MTRADLVIAILELWSKDTSLADAEDEHGYTHASCGFESAQSDVQEILSLSEERLTEMLDHMTDPARKS